MKNHSLIKKKEVLINYTLYKTKCESKLFYNHIGH